MIVLVGLMAVSAALLLTLTAPLSFIADEWNLTILRTGWGPNQILDHFNGHSIMLPALEYKILLEVFGMESARPMQVLAIATFLLMNALLFAYLRVRVGDWAALIATALVLFLGAAFEDLLWAFQIVYFGSLAAGIGALIALDRDSRSGDRVATFLLVVSVMFSGVGLAFMAAAVMEWVLNPRDRKRRLSVPGVPVLLYMTWWLIWGTGTSSGSMSPEFSFEVLPKVPGYVFEALSSGLVAVTGLGTDAGGEPVRSQLTLGRIGAVALIVFAIWRIARLPKIPRALWVSGAGLLALLLLFALGQDSFLSYAPQTERPPYLSRYQLPIAVFILLFIGNLLRGIKLNAWVLGVAGVLAVFAISSGIQLLNARADEWQSGSDYMRAKLSGVELAGARFPDSTFRLGTTFDLSAGDYLNAVDSYGSPAYPPGELGSLSQALRIGADGGLLEVAGIGPTGNPPEFGPGDCDPLNPGVPVNLSPGAYAVVNRGDSEVGVNISKFSDHPGMLAGYILPDSTAGLDLPAVAAEPPWTVSLAGEGPALICSGRR